MSFAKPELPYPLDALSPQLSKETLEYHWGKHHLAYWTKLNALTKDNEWQAKAIEVIIKEATGVLYNQAAQVYNHSFYWQCMKSNPQRKENEPTGKVAELITAKWGSFAKFKELFDEAAGGHFGSGWAWLILKDDKTLEILATHDADCPLKGNRGTPILTCDVWEHAYYIDYRNARPQYLKNWWELVNWEFANKNLAQAGL